MVDPLLRLLECYPWVYSAGAKSVALALRLGVFLLPAAGLFFALAQL